MKTREGFETIRNRMSNRFSLRVRLTVVVCLELVFCVLLAWGFDALLGDALFKRSESKLFVELVVISALVGAVATSYVSRYFFDPVKRLIEAMERVADGDFSVRLDTKSDSKEVRDMFYGFNLMTRELSSTEVLQTDFVSNVSHEFKTPITAIEGYTTLLQGCENLDADQQAYIEKILFNTKRLSTLVGNILLLSKIENQSIQTKHAKFRLDEQIRQSIVALEPAWSEKDIEFDVEMDSVEYVGNEGLMHHVWDNLIGNAVKFNPACGLVRIRLQRKTDGIVFTVEDNGPGISEEAKKHIFDKFYQEDSSHKEEGNGLGLALVKQILLIAGGEIAAENIAGGGCRFTVVLKG